MFFRGAPWVSPSVLPGWGVCPCILGLVQGFAALRLSLAPPLFFHCLCCLFFSSFFFLGGSACSSPCLLWAGARTGGRSVWLTGLLLVLALGWAVPRPHGSGVLCTRLAWWPLLSGQVLALPAGRLRQAVLGGAGLRGVGLSMSLRLCVAGFRFLVAACVGGPSLSSPGVRWPPVGVALSHGCGRVPSPFRGMRRLARVRPSVSVPCFGAVVCFGAPCCVPPCFAVLRCAGLCCAAVCSALLCRAAPCRALVCCAVSWLAVLCCDALRRVVLGRVV